LERQRYSELRLPVCRKRRCFISWISEEFRTRLPGDLMLPADRDGDDRAVAESAVVGAKALVEELRLEDDVAGRLPVDLTGTD
jgi:hypothetical protein